MRMLCRHKRMNVKILIILNLCVDALTVGRQVFKQEDLRFGLTKPYLQETYN